MSATNSNSQISPSTWQFSVFGLQVSLLIRRELFERAKDFNIILDDVAITELSFSREYTAAVEAKQVGEYVLPRAATRWRQSSVVISCWLVPPQPSRKHSVLSSMWRKPSRTRDRRSSKLREKLRLPRWWDKVTGFPVFTGPSSATTITECMYVCVCVVGRGSDQESRLPEAPKDPCSPEYCQDGKMMSRWLRLRLNPCVYIHSRSWERHHAVMISTCKKKASRYLNQTWKRWNQSSLNCREIWFILSYSDFFCCVQGQLRYKSEIELCTCFKCFARSRNWIREKQLFDWTWRLSSQRFIPSMQHLIQFACCPPDGTKDTHEGSRRASSCHFS